MGNLTSEYQYQDFEDQFDCYLYRRPSTKLKAKLFDKAKTLI